MFGYVKRAWRRTWTGGVVRGAICEIEALRTLSLDVRFSEFFYVAQLLDDATLHGH